MFFEPSTGFALLTVKIMQIRMCSNGKALNDLRFQNS